MTTLDYISVVLADAGRGHDGGWWFPFAFLWVAVIGTVVWLVVRSVRGRGPSGLDRASDILAERYARGEITGEEYRERRDQLQG